MNMHRSTLVYLYIISRQNTNKPNIVSPLKNSHANPSQESEIRKTMAELKRNKSVFDDWSERSLELVSDLEAKRCKAEFSYYMKRIHSSLVESIYVVPSDS